MTYWYISFATDEGFRGATVVEATSAQSALAVATLRGLNPGGQVAILQVPPGAESDPDKRAMMNRLVGRAEMIARGAERYADLPQDIREAFDAESERVCEACNAASQTN